MVPATGVYGHRPFAQGSDREYIVCIAPASKGRHHSAWKWNLAGSLSADSLFCKTYDFTNYQLYSITITRLLYVVLRGYITRVIILYTFLIGNNNRMHGLDGTPP